MLLIEGYHEHLLSDVVKMTTTTYSSDDFTYEVLRENNSGHSSLILESFYIWPNHMAYNLVDIQLSIAYFYCQSPK